MAPNVPPREASDRLIIFQVGRIILAQYSFQHLYVDGSL